MRAEGRSQPRGVKSQGLDVQSKRPLRCRALSLPLAHYMDMVYPRCRRVLRWGRTDKAQWLGLEGRGWRAKTQPGTSSGPRGAGRSSEQRCREPSIHSTGTQLPRARVSPLAPGQQSPTSPTWSCRRASSGERQAGGTGPKRKRNRRGWRRARGSPRASPSRRDSTVCGRPLPGEQGRCQRTPLPPPRIGIMTGLRP